MAPWDSRHSQSIDLVWVTATVIVTVFVVKRLVDSSYGRAFKCIREDDIAAEAVGINLYRHKTLSFVFSSFFVGIAGGLLTEILGTIDPNVFRSSLTYAIMTMAVLGGMQSITGGIIAAAIYTVMSELLRSVEAPRIIFGLDFPAARAADAGLCHHVAVTHSLLSQGFDGR